MKRIASALAAVAVATLGTLALASPAMATDPEPHYATGDWQLQDWPGTYPDITPVDAEVSEVDCDGQVLALTKPAGDVGTSYENTDLGLEVQTGQFIAVEYELSSADNAVSGAVRMFAYDGADADTLNDAPTFGPAIADPSGGTTGTLLIQFPSAGTVGTFGLTYDASNITTGTVTFTNLRTFILNEEPTPISLCAKPEPPATETETTPPATETTTANPATTTTTSTAPTLPVTGSGLTGLIAVAAVLVVAGAAVVVVARRRRA